MKSALTQRILPYLLLVLATLPAAAQTTVIRAGRLLDPATGTAAENQLIVVEDGRIRAVGAGLAVPDGATVIDLSDRTVLPGLFDAHTHMSLTVRRARDGGNYYVTTLLDPTPYRAIQGVANARDMLAAGFTTIRDIGNAGNYADTALRLALEEGLVPGPTMQNAGRIIAPFGGQFHLQPERRALGEPEYFFADTRDELKKAVRENIHFGATLIKLVVDDQPYIYTADDIRFVVEEAGKAGLKVAAHCWTEQGARNAVEGGVASIEHGPAMPDDLLHLAKDKGVYLVGTEFTEDAIRESFGLTDEAEVKALHAQFVDRLGRAYRIGVPIAFGSDMVYTRAGQTRGTLSLGVIESFIEAGVPAPAILRMMTTNAAELLGLSAERGAVRPGLAADLIATPGNPFEDIRALYAVSFVMKNGVVVKRAGPHR